jgi:hypothetical protein
MCLISTPIQKVSKTKILVGPNHNKSRQLTVYSNFVNNISDSNAMVLPVPLPNSVQFINLSGYTDLFEDCAECFYNPNRLRSLGTFSTNSYNTRDDKPLEVFNVGSYQVSLAKSLEQLNRVDLKVFTLSPGLKQTLEMFYYQPYWGFIICKLAKGSEEYHPFGYSHDIIDNKIYIPTRHYHQETKWADVNEWTLGLPIDPKQNPFSLSSWDESNIDNSPMFKSEQFGKTTAEAYGWVNSGFDGNKKLNGYGYPNGYANGYANEFANRFGNDDPDILENSNGLAKMSSKANNLRKLNDKNYKSGQDNFISNKSNLPNTNAQTQTQTQTQTHTYKQVADDWSHSIYLVNLNPSSNEQLVQMNSCREVWDSKSLFDPEKINFNFGYCNNFVKLQIDGTHPNIDLVIPMVPSA